MTGEQTIHDEPPHFRITDPPQSYKLMSVSPEGVVQFFDTDGSVIYESTMVKLVNALRHVVEQQEAEA